MELFEALSTVWTLTVVSVALLIYTVVKVYAVTINPLSNIPGPNLSKWTNLRLKWAVIAGERCRYIHRLHRVYGPIVRISPDEVSISDIPAAKTIYKMGSRFYKTKWYERFTGFKTRSLFTTTDGHWHGQHRRLVAANFSEKWIKNLEPFIARNVKLAAARMWEEAESRGHCDVFKWFTFMATDVIGEAAFGDSFRVLETGKKNQYILDLESFGSKAVLRTELPWLITAIAYLPVGPGKEIKNIPTRMGGYAVQSVDRYWTQLKADPENVKPTLLTKEYAGVENGTFPVEQLRRDAVGYIAAGTDTTAITATYAVWMLALHPEEEAALIRDVAALPEQFDDEDLKEIKRLDNVISETLRLYGAVQQGLPRAVPPEGAELCGHYLAGGTTVGVQAHSIHRDPTVWPDPDSFQPSRWQKPTREMRDSFYPFGGGSRVCIGMHFANLELRHALANFYRTFTRGVKPAFVDGFRDSDMRQMAFFIDPPKGHRCFVAPRT